MIKKEKVLVRDNKGIFLKMFKRKFKSEFDFSEDSFLLKNENKSGGFDHSVFVVYEYSELVDFFELDGINTNSMVCLFSKHLYNSLSRIEEIKDLILIDASKSKTEIFEDLKVCFKKSSSLLPKLSQNKFVKSKMPKKQLEVLQRALYFMM
ncbi:MULTISPECIES: hypothetical protein [unclassified Flavobacterium]|jgi:hypothetical protein|uniref:hypothetical protein n=1 Tax=unclassified Flavobacterium TaxID=196869 RepID=UPI00070D33F3|nr:MULTISPECIES: hypothetical protein [unclassified Flavobacterium]KRD61507.1 hypothetical protein ASE40_08230 [Flavobacterium sp. Root935]TDX12623.1 hypothetical protein EDB96_1696 [Flavobacterium sp. S87F.05.LMB.W.Kidney.N]BDU27192.1 hypothetical protein FLGSB24_39360 [Flavobacterium sp. GSB-24]